MKNGHAVDICRMVALAAIAITPMIVLSHELSEDEFIKSGAGIALVAAVGLAIKALSKWRSD